MVGLNLESSIRGYVIMDKLFNPPDLNFLIYKTEMFVIPTTSFLARISDISLKPYCLIIMSTQSMIAIQFLLLTCIFQTKSGDR